MVTCHADGVLVYCIPEQLGELQAMDTSGQDCTGYLRIATCHADGLLVSVSLKIR